MTTCLYLNNNFCLKVLWELLTHEVPYRGIEGFQVAWLVVEKGEVSHNHRSERKGRVHCILIQGINTFSFLDGKKDLKIPVKMRSNIMRSRILVMIKKKIET